MLRFSQRNGKAPIKLEIQTESVDDGLRNKLWNVYDSYFTSRLPISTFLNETYYQEHYQQIWHHFFKRTLDTCPRLTNGIKSEIRAWFFRAEWYEIYDFLEASAQTTSPINVQKFLESCNQALEEELSGYRFIGNQITSITNETELGEIQNALINTESNGLTGIQIHLQKAIKQLSDRKKPDYANSIKESISAVEAACCAIVGEKCTLGDALNKIEKGKKVDLHPALKGAFEKMYGYTSDEGGIRHAQLREEKCDHADAQFMLVSCSAFVNYLLSKAEKAKVQIK